MGNPDKLSLGKLKLAAPLLDIIHYQQTKNNLELLDIRLTHIWVLANLAPHHRDPFDRMIIAQALGDQLPVITSDHIFAQYPIQTIPA